MRTRFALVGLLAPALVAQGQPTFYAAWEDGREAESHSRWKAARMAYQRALVLRPQPASRVVIYGNNLLRDYYPHVRIARCNLELGELDAVEAELRASEAAGEPAALRQELSARLSSLRRPAPVLPAPALATPVQRSEPPPVHEQGDQPPQSHPPSQPSVPVPAQRPSRAETAAPVLLAKPATPARTEAAPVPVAPAASMATPRPIPDRSTWPWWLLGAAGGGFLLWRLRRRRPPEVTREGHPTRLGAYEIERLLGRGGFASTYLARHGRTGQRVALKVLHPYRQDDPEFVGRFRQEARLGAMMDHPGIVRLLELGPEQGTLWLAMEYVEGQRLGDWLKDQGPLERDRLLDLGLQLGEAMAYAHGLGVVHRDLKPANILLVEGRIKVADFGIARQVDTDTLTATYAFLGTPAYAAPEAQHHTRIGPEADLYSLGILLFEMAAGSPPFQGSTPFAVLDAHRMEPLPDLGALRPDLPGELVALVKDLCSKEPERRPSDAEVLAVFRLLRDGALG